MRGFRSLVTYLPTRHGVRIRGSAELATKESVRAGRARPLDLGLERTAQHRVCHLGYTTVRVVPHQTIGSSICPDGVDGVADSAMTFYSVPA